ncbi:unnamed protein product [Peronospora belbahrii]|uniref:Uncharacterized protein n=1 Tax=Peronospora belbahrii TaxID=622444 RepID=A0ABN8CMF0_9STRA|nr:unnamed protein product [Peronospora belbahrii]
MDLVEEDPSSVTCATADWTLLYEDLEKLFDDNVEVERKKCQLYKERIILPSDASAQEAQTQQRKDCEGLNMSYRIAENIEDQHRILSSKAMDDTETPFLVKSFLELLEQEVEALKTRNKVLEGSLKNIQAQVEIESAASLKYDRRATPASSRLNAGRIHSKGWFDQCENFALIVAQDMKDQSDILEAHQVPLLATLPTAEVIVQNVSSHKEPIYNNDERAPIPSSFIKPSTPLFRRSVDNLALGDKATIVQQGDVIREWNVHLDEKVKIEVCTEDLCQILQQHIEVYQSLMEKHMMLCQHISQMRAQGTNAEISTNQDTLLQREWGTMEKTLKYREPCPETLKHMAGTCLKSQKRQLEMKVKAQAVIAAREKSRDKVQILESVICQVNDRDSTVWNTKWEAFRKRLDALENEIQVEQQRRKLVDKDSVSKEAQPLTNQPDNQSKTYQLRSRVDALEKRERLLIGQLQVALETVGWKEKQMRLQTELFETRIPNEELQVAEERHDTDQKDWNQAEIALKRARRSIGKLQMKPEALRSEQDVAEAGYGDALEENLLLREKEKKLKLLREAMIKVRQVFLKAENCRACKTASAHYAMNRDLFARKRKEMKRREYKEKKLKEKKTRLHSQVTMLQMKLDHQKKKRDQQQRRKKRIAAQGTIDKKMSALESDFQALKYEVAPLKRLLHDKTTSEARVVEDQEELLQILQAQNLALRVASAHESTCKAGTKLTCEQCKVFHLVNILMLCLTEKQVDAPELEHYNMQFSNMEQMENYKAQLRRLRQRLVQHGMSFKSSVNDYDSNCTTVRCPNSRLQCEEQHYVVGHELEEKSLSRSNEMQNKEYIMVVKDARLLELELENESLRHKYTRLQRKNRCGACFASQRSFGDQRDSKDAPKKYRRAKGVGSKDERSPWSAHERLELEDVATKVRKVIERLHAENKKLKKAAADQASVSPERVDSMRQKLRVQNNTRELEAQLQQLRHESSELRIDKHKLQQQLCAKTPLPSLPKSENSLELQLKEKDRQLLQSEQELAELRNQVLQLKLQVARNASADDDASIKHKQQQRLNELQRRRTSNTNTAQAVRGGN